MSNIERVLIDYHRSRGDSKVVLRDPVNTPDGELYLMRFYNEFGSCYSSLDRIDENGVVVEVARCHRVEERQMLRPYEVRRKSHETDSE